MAIQRNYVSVAMLDGTEHQNIPTIVADEMLYASTRRRLKWDPPQDDPITFNNFMGYAALRRSGAFSGSFDDFERAAAKVVLEEGEPVDPTNPAPSNDS
ncbi:hypothetical protein IU431_06680 [Nocardia otitidiscaviarum]|uniref:hypothetical protein n=1 Tax=Nocardia otitidiscaviarum TaxID=1823 RepID=UPI0004A6F2B3|nr:hypothetical protein [Nocardia otitidiscaviarum]MBF6483842.1 hypothetical protein [Nocardia otitidiscaviarum]